MPGFKYLKHIHREWDYPRFKLFSVLTWLAILIVLPDHSKGQMVEDGINPRIDYHLGVGISSSSYRDFATSPLLYTGTILALDFKRVKVSHSRESQTGIIYTGGYVYGQVNGFRNTISILNSIFIQTTQLFNINSFQSPLWNLKAGGSLNFAGNLRDNSSLLNNSFGLEAIGTLFVTGKLSRDISRNSSKNIDFLFLNFDLPPRKRSVSYQLNIAALNATYRNGYAYSNQSGILNDYKPFYDYEFNIFSGFRLGSTLQYIQHLKNRNAIALSYTWDVSQTGGSADTFEMSSHIFTFSLLFNAR
jgi:hypothetical protein